MDSIMDQVVDFSGWLADIAASDNMDFWLLIQVVLLAVLVGGALWWRRRRRQK